MRHSRTASWGPGRTNGARWSIETKNYRSLSPCEQLHWRHVCWSVKRWLEAQGFTDRSERHFEDPEEEIEWRVRQSWHFKGEETIYVPRVAGPGWFNSSGGAETAYGNAIDSDGKCIVNGDVKCLVIRGRLVRGRVFHNINNMWWVAVGGRVYNEASHRLCDWQSKFLHLRRWMSPADRVLRLTRVKADLVKSEQYERAAVVRDVLKSWEGILEHQRATRAQESAR